MIFLFSSLIICVLCGQHINAAPRPPISDIKDIKLYCIHPADTTYKETTVNDIGKNLDLKLGFAFYAHGWTSKFDFDEKESLTFKIGKEWMKTEKTNFCGVDWRELASDSYYNASQNHIKTVGTQLATFILALNERKVKMENITIAGHSLGAHVAGLAGKSVFERSRTKVSAIFGLDPAGPFFTSALVIHSDYCLSKDDAKFVQVLHTSSAYGTSSEMGHADFYVNNGIMQKACLDEFLTAKNFSLLQVIRMNDPVSLREISVLNLRAKKAQLLLMFMESTITKSMESFS